MNKTISLEKLSTAEKIELMEKLWVDLTSSEKYIPPAWHRNELARRRKSVSEGIEGYVTWENAKKEIRNELC